MTAQQKTREKFIFSGVNNDLPVNQLPPDVFSFVKNMEVHDIGMRASPGHNAAYGTPLFSPEHLVYNKTAGEFFWLYASSDGVGVTNGQSHFDISPAAAVTSTWPANWTAALLNNLVVLNNAKDAPFYWDNQTANIMLPLPGWPVGSTCRAMRSFNYNLIAMDIAAAGGDFISQLMWSNSADPGTIPSSWTPLPENDAGDNVLADTIGALVDGVQVRSSFLLFKEHSTFIMNFIGGNFVFGFRKLFTTSGVLTTGCVAEYLGNAVILTDGDLIMTDQQSARSLIDKRMRSWLFNNIDSTSYVTSFVVSYQSENQVWCCFPETGQTEPNLALVWDGRDNKFGVRDLVPPAAHVARGQIGNVSGVIDWDSDAQSWNSDTTNWKAALFNPTEDALLQADRTLNLTYAINESDSYNGEVINSRVERLGLDFGEIKRIKLVRSVIPRITAQAGSVLEIRIGASSNDANIVNWSPTVIYTVGQSEKIDTYAQGRFIAFSVESKVKQLPWILHGMDFDFDMQGYY